MTCKFCENARRFFRNGVQRLAPFTEYDDTMGNTYVVANVAMVMVGSNNALHVSFANIPPTVEMRQDGNYMAVDFADGQAMGFKVIASRKVFSNRFS